MANVLQARVIMADVLEVDVEDKTEFEQDEEADEGIQRLKSAVTKRKGRGFKGDQSMKKDEEYESIDVDQASETGPARSVEGWILFVTNVHEEAQEDDLHDMFSEYGEIKNIHVNLDRRTGFLKGYALIEYETFKEAQSAMEALNGADLLEQKITVDWSFVRGPGDRRSRPGGIRTRRY